MREAERHLLQIGSLLIFVFKHIIGLFVYGSINLHGFLIIVPQRLGFNKRSSAMAPDKGMGGQDIQDIPFLS